MSIHPQMQRLEDTLKELGWKKSEFVKRYELVEPEFKSQNYNNWRKRGIPALKMSAVAEVLGVTRDWLEQGKGKPQGINDAPAVYAAASGEERYMTLYGKLDADQRAAVIHLMEVMTEPGHTANMPLRNGVKDPDKATTDRT